MIPKQITSQRDFSAGEIDVAAKRADENPLFKAGARQASNLRILNSRAIQNRSGRRTLWTDSVLGRVEEVLMSPGNTFRLQFGNDGSLKVRDSAGAAVFTQAAATHLWRTATIGQIDWAVYLLSIYIVFPGQVPKVLTWDGVSTWSIANYAESVSSAGRKNTFFYRLSPKNITLAPSALTGVINITFSAGMNLVAGHVGTRMRYAGSQITIATVTSATTGTATVNETLPPCLRVDFGVAPTGFAIGEVAQGSTSGTIGEIVAIAAGASVTVQVTKGGTFNNGEYLVSPTGRGIVTNVATVASPGALGWDDEVMNSYRLWPQSVFVDQGRVGFCNFPPLPTAIGWSQNGAPDNLYVGANPTDAMMEIAPDKVQVLYVVPGPESSEFVFCDKKIFYIPISETNPLKPGSVAFKTISGDGCAAVRPRPVQEVIIYVNAGTSSVRSIVAPGAYYRPFETRDISEMHNHLIKSPVALAVPTADSSFPERYIYCLNNDGTLAVGKYSVKSGQIEGVVGWVPHSGNATIKWAAALGSNVIFTSSYAPNAISPVLVAEALDDTYYLDAGLLVNAIPAALTPPGGKGPLWWIPGGTVDLMDVGARPVNLSTVNSIGNMTADSGLASAFNGTYVQTKAQGASKAAADGYVGLNYTARQIIGQVLVWPTSDQGFAVGGSGNITLDLYGSTALPASATDGTLLATVSIANQTVGPVAISPNYNVTSYQYSWVRIRQSGASAVCCAQAFFATGPLWWLNGGTIQVGARMMGTYAIDANGFIVPQFVAGENLTSLTLVAGQPWTATLEPFVPAVQPGQDVQQRMRKRRIARAEIYVSNSSGFRLDTLYPEQQGSSLPAPGTVTTTRRVATWNQGDDATQPPPLREKAYTFHPRGRAYDPRVAVVKDTPGPLIIHEFGMEVTV